MSGDIIGYSTLQVIPSLRGMEARLNSQASALGKASGGQIAAGMQASIASRAKTVYAPLLSAGQSLTIPAPEIGRPSIPVPDLPRLPDLLAPEVGQPVIPYPDLFVLSDLVAPEIGQPEIPQPDLPAIPSLPAPEIPAPDTSQFESGLSKLGPLVAGAGIGAAVAASFSEALSREASGDKLAAQLGLNPAESAAIGRVAGDLYANAYGESLSAVNDSIRDVQLNISGMSTASEAKLENVTASVLDIAAAFDQDTAAITRAAGQLERTGMASSAREALDIITVGFQNGADKSEDFLDTLNEYGTQFRKLGIDGETATGLLTQGLQAGARDADVVADAFKEFSIRAVDGSESTAQGFDDLGVSAKKMSDRVGSGGKTAADATALILDKLRRVEDPAKRAQIAVKLFGTQSEDLGDALFKLDLDTATKGMGRLEGAAKKMGDTLNDNASARVTAFKRNLETNVVNFLGNQVVPGLEAIGDVASDAFGLFNRLPGPAKDAAVAIGAIVVASKGLEMLKATSFVTGLTNVATTAGDAEKRVAALKGAARLAAGAGGLLLLTDAADRSSGAVAGLESAAGGALTGFAIGGPWGAAIGTAGGLLAAFSSQSQKAAAAQERLDGMGQAVADTLDQQSGALTRATEAAVRKELADAGAYDAATTLGLSFDTVTQAALGNEKAIRKVSAATKNIPKGDFNDEDVIAYATAQKHLTGIIGANGDAIAARRKSLEQQAQAERDAMLAARDNSAAYREAAGAGRKMGGAIDEIGISLPPTTKALGDQAAATKDAHDAIVGYRSAAASVIDRQLGLAQAIMDANDALRDNKDGFDKNTEAGQKNWRQLLDIASATEGFTGKTDKGRAAIERARTSIIEFADAQGMTQTEAERTADRLLGVAASAKKVDDQPANVKVNVDAADADRKIDEFERNYYDMRSGITGKTVTFEMTSQAAKVADQLGVSMAFGGPVPGWMGTPGKDSVPIIGMPNEHMVTAGEVKAAGHGSYERGHAELKKFRRGLLAGALEGLPQGYAAGGPVFDVRGSQSGIADTGRLLRSVFDTISQGLSDALSKQGSEYLRQQVAYSGRRVWPLPGAAWSTYPGHDGIDLNLPGEDYGRPFYAAASGRISYTGWNRGYGDAIFETGPWGEVVYGHGSRVFVKGGDNVVAGQKIGLIGSTGKSTGPHLHFGFPGGTEQGALGFLKGATGQPGVTTTANTRSMGSMIMDSGGLLPPGTTVVHNNTGKNETVRTAAQEERRAKREERTLKALERWTNARDRGILSARRERFGAQSPVTAAVEGYLDRLKVGEAVDRGALGKIVAGVLDRNIGAAVRGFKVKSGMTAADTRGEMNELIASLRETLGRGSPLLDRISNLGDRLIEVQHRQDKLAATYDKATEQLRATNTASREYAQSVASAYTHDAFGGSAGESMLQLRADRNDALEAAEDLRRAENKGLSGGLARQVQSSGNTSLIHELSKMSRREIDQYERLLARRNRATADLGGQSANALYGDAIRQQTRVNHNLNQRLNQLDRTLKQLDRTQKQLGNDVRLGAHSGTRRGNAERDHSVKTRRKARR